LARHNQMDGLTLELVIWSSLPRIWSVLVSYR